MPGRRPLDLRERALAELVQHAPVAVARLACPAAVHAEALGPVRLTTDRRRARRRPPARAPRPAGHRCGDDDPEELLRRLRAAFAR